MAGGMCDLHFARTIREIFFNICNKEIIGQQDIRRSNVRENLCTILEGSEVNARQITSRKGLCKRSWELTYSHDPAVIEIVSYLPHIL